MRYEKWRQISIQNSSLEFASLLDLDQRSPTGCDSESLWGYSKTYFSSEAKAGLEISFFGVLFHFLAYTSAYGCIFAHRRDWKFSSFFWNGGFFSFNLRIRIQNSSHGVESSPRIKTKISVRKIPAMNFICHAPSI